MSSTAEDEALARALQEEFRRDYEASLARSRQPPPSAPSEELIVPPPSSRESEEQLARRLEQERRDAEMARRLYQDDSRRSRRGTYTAGTPVTEAVTLTETSTPPRRLSVRPTSVHRSRAAAVGQSARESTDSSRGSSGPGTSGQGTSDVSRLTDSRPTSSNPTSRSQSSQNPNPSINQHRQRSRSKSRGRTVGPARNPIDPSMSAMVDSSTPHPRTMYPIDIDGSDDIELAMKMQQEERDAALAAQMAREEQEAASSRVTVRETRRAERERNRGCTIRKVLGFVIPVAVVAAAVILVIMFVGGTGDIPGFPGIMDTPHNSGETNEWRNDGHGLKLEVVNALQEQWFEAFTLAMNDWENGGKPIV